MSGPADTGFPSTRWSLVAGMHAPGAGEAGAALAELALRYWYPVYAYVRLSGHAPAVAQDITQTFFQQLPCQYAGEGAAARGRFRVWLLTSLRTFLTRDWHELAQGESRAGVPGLQDLERRYLRERATGASSEMGYQRSFAMEVLARGYRRLCAEARTTGHFATFVELRPFLACDPLPQQYEDVCLRLHAPTSAMRIALDCLRRRLRELVCTELADTVASPGDFALEQQALYGVLRGSGCSHAGT